MSNIQSMLRQLRLSGLVQSLSVRLQEATVNRLEHSEFLELILQDELNVRHQRQMVRRTKAAEFRTLKTLEDFDWQFNSSINRRQMARRSHKERCINSKPKPLAPKSEARMGHP